jgi:hypothetical protein
MTDGLFHSLQKTFKQLTMKQLFILIFIGLGVLCASAQENTDNQISTIFSKGRNNGGYGALSFEYTQIDGKDAFLIGARGSWIIDHSFAIGFGGKGFINDVNYDNWRYNNLDYNLAGGYGGLYLEPILAPRLPVHISFPVLFGVGAVAQVEDHHDWTYDNSRSDAFLVFEPAVELEFNMTRHLRLAGTIGYRFTSKIEMVNTNSDVMEGANIGLILKFGRF